MFALMALPVKTLRTFKGFAPYAQFPRAALAAAGGRAPRDSSYGDISGLR